MAKILTFRNKGDAPSGQGFLTDENETLSFRKTEDGRISLGNISRSHLSGLFPDPKKDWSNQELADLFRVHQLLSRANVPVETDRGVTDEGDPWFVFCHANGEVFIHLCRIDGAYVLDSPNVVRALRGADFNELIADFTNQALPAGNTSEEPARRVIRLERGGKVRLHPSAMLAALIWTLFLASEELVLLAPEETEADSDTLLDFDIMVSLETGQSINDDLLFSSDTVDVAHFVRDSSFLDTHHDTPESHAQIREAQQGLVANSNTFTMGLSTIAIAMGFMSETVLLNNQRQVLDGLETLGLSERFSETSDAGSLQIKADGNNNLIEALADFLGLQLHHDDMQQVADAELKSAESLFLEQELNTLKKSASTYQDFATASKQSPLTVEENENNLTELPSETDGNLNGLQEVSEVPLQDSPSANVDESDTSTLLSRILQAYQVKMEEIQIDSGTIWVSSEADNKTALELFDWVDERPDAPEEVRDLGNFATVAQRMMDFLEKKTANIGVIELSSGSGIIFVDRLAVEMGDVDYMHWEANDGKIISLIGFEADLQQFDMIA